MKKISSITDGLGTRIRSIREKVSHEGGAKRVIFEGHIDGYQYHSGLDIEHLFTPGAQLTLKHEPENPFDNNAVAVYFNNRKVGFVPHYANYDISSILRTGKQLEARISRYEPGTDTWQRVTMEIQSALDEEVA